VSKRTIRINDINGDPILDEWDQEQFADSEIVEELPCLFFWKDTLVQTSNGPITTKTPTLYVSNKDKNALVEGDIISNVRTRTNKPLLETGKVDTVNLMAGFGE